MQVRIPVVIGPVRDSAKTLCAMVDDDLGANHLSILRSFLSREARAKGVEPTKEWLATTTRQVLDLYQKADDQRRANKGDTVGHVYECDFPSGNSLLLGTKAALTRAPASADASL